MKIPEEPPNFYSVFEKDPPTFFKAMARADVQTLLRKSASQYPYWDKLKYWPMPEGITPELLWTLREWSAQAERKKIPLVATSGNPFSYWLPNQAQEWLYQIDRNAPSQLSLEGNPPSAQERDRYIVSSLMEEAIASSQIEGAATTRRVAKEMLRTKRPPADKSERMILNNYRAIERLRVLKDSPLTLELLHELHAILTQGAIEEPEAAGRLRRSPQDDDISVIDDGADPHILHMPPKGSELPRRLERFLAFANDERQESFIHPVIKAILLHFWLAYDHPYVDGNGRAARAVFYWYLLRKGYWLFEFVSLSRMVLRAAGQYYRAFLYSERGEKDATYFIMFNLQAIHLAINEVQKHIAHKQAEMRQAAALLRGVRGLNGRQRELLLDALKKPGRTYTIYGHQQTQQVSYQTARNDLFGLADKQLLTVSRSGKTFEFVPSEKLPEMLKADHPKPAP
ncbi:MAG: Fic family protein [Elusimicrobia bacterium]|nr:Fic family protein [Elusimicrobiota bacterium]